MNNYFFTLADNPLHKPESGKMEIVKDRNIQSACRKFGEEHNLKFRKVTVKNTYTNTHLAEYNDVTYEVNSINGIVEDEQDELD